MLVEKLIRDTMELQGFRVKEVKMNSLRKGLEVMLVPDKRFTPRCGVCGKKARYRDTRSPRRFRHVPLWGIGVELVYSPRRVICPNCDGVHVESMPWVSGKRRFTKALMLTIAKWARRLSWKDVSRLFLCSWSTVAEAVGEAVCYGIKHRDLSEVTHIGIDEISRRKGHIYLTNVYDLKEKRLLWSKEGRAKETLHAFFDWFGEEKIKHLEGVCCDMWEPYVEVIKERAPEVVLVFDKFHIVRHLTGAVDEVRREEIREKGKSHKEVVKGTKYIWLKNPWNLTERQRARLSYLERLNLKISRAYLLKEAFREFWEHERPSDAALYLAKWKEWAINSRLEPMRKFARMLTRHGDDLLNYFEMPINNGTVEGLNNKAKVVSRKAYGFRTPENYIRNLYHCMAKLPLPETMHTFA